MKQCFTLHCLGRFLTVELVVFYIPLDTWQVLSETSLSRKSNALILTIGKKRNKVTHATERHTRKTNIKNSP